MLPLRLLGIIIATFLAGPALSSVKMRTFSSNFSRNLAYSIALAGDGGYAILANISNSASTSYVWVVKTDSSGNMVWTRSFGAGKRTVGRHIIQTQDGGFVIVGYTNAHSFLGTHDGWAIKITSAGDLVWEQLYDRSFEDRCYYVARTEDGGVVVTGTSYLFIDFSYVFVMKLDSSGNTVRDLCYADVSVSSFGRALTVTDDGGVAVVGYLAKCGASAYRVLLFRLNATFGVVWNNTFNIGTTSRGLDIAKRDDDKGFIIVGKANLSSATGYDALVIVTDAEGRFVRSQTFGGPTEDVAVAIAETHDHGFVLAGWTNKGDSAAGSDAWVIKLDKHGDAVWNASFGGQMDDYGAAIVQNSNGGFAMAGDISTSTTSSKLLLVVADCRDNVPMLKDGDCRSCSVQSLNGTASWCQECEEDEELQCSAEMNTGIDSSCVPCSSKCGSCSNSITLEPGSTETFLEQDCHMGLSWAWTLLIVVILVGVGAAIYYYNKQRQAKKMELLIQGQNDPQREEMKEMPPAGDQEPRLMSVEENKGEFTGVRNCARCLRESHVVRLVPCGHAVLCRDCADKLTQIGAAHCPEDGCGRDFTSYDAPDGV